MPLKNAKEVTARILAMAKGMPERIGRALYRETLIESLEVVRRTPVDTGRLRSTIRVIGPIYSGNRITCYIVAGGNGVEYAIFVHEDPDALHLVGQWKYVESVILESRAYIGQRVARSMAAEIVSSNNLL